MKTKKFNFDWKSVVLGMVLCMVLVVFMGSRAQGNQTQTRTGVMQKTVTMNVLMDKSELIDQRILVLEGKLNRLQEDMNRVLDDTGNLRRQGATK
jgi:hypothetical protein